MAALQDRGYIVKLVHFFHSVPITRKSGMPLFHFFCVDVRCRVELVTLSTTMDASETVVKLLSHLSIDELRIRFEESNSGDHLLAGSLNLTQFLLATQIDNELNNDDEMVHIFLASSKTNKLNLLVYNLFIYFCFLFF